MVRLAPVAVALVLCLAPSPGARAEQGVEPPLVDLERLFIPVGDSTIIMMPAMARVTVGHVTPMTITTPETGSFDTDTDTSGYMRLRLEPGVLFQGNTWDVFQAYKIHAEVDARYYLLADPVAPVLSLDPERAQRDEDIGPDLVQLYALAAGEHAALKLGLTRSTWGAGLLVNDGSEPTADLRESPFGFARWNDRYARFQAAFFPLGLEKRGEARVPPLTLAVAADMVIEDGNAEWSRGDRAYHAIAAIKGDHGRFKGGFYAVYRHQDHWQGGRTEVTVFDLHARVDIARERLKAWVEGEFALMVGSTTLARSAIHPGPFDVFATGGLARFGVALDWFEGVVEAGGASADDNPFDDKQRAFTFNRNHRVGLLLFQEQLRTSTAVSAYNLADPKWRGEPPRGYQTIPTGGALRGVNYVNPRLRFIPVEGLSLLTGFVFAASSADMSDPFWSGLDGGAPIGPNGALQEDVIGVEVDLGVRYDFERIGPMDLSLQVEFAWASPGGAFDQRDGSAATDIFGVWGHVEARF